MTAIGETLRIPIGTADATGAAVNADTLPVVVVLQQGTPMPYVPVVTNIATGVYEAAIVCSAANGFADGREYSAYLTVVVSGITGRDGIASFRVGRDPQLGDTIRACFGTAAATGAAQAADSLPTAVVLEQGSALGYAPVVTSITTGVYEVAVVASASNGFELGKEYTAYVTVTLSGVTGSDGVLTFRMPRDTSTATTTTPESIRDRAIAVIEALTPASDSGLRFRAYRNEGRADFQTWAEANAAASRRRFQVRTRGSTFTPPVSNTDVEEHQCTLSVLLAYPQTSRDGRAAALDRDDTSDTDQFQIDAAIGMLSRANFSPPYPDACWIEGSPGERISGKNVDFVEFTFTYIYKRSRQF